MRDSEPFFNSFLGRLVIVWMSFNFLILLMKLNGLDHDGNIAWRVFLSPLWSFDLFLLYMLGAGVCGLITYVGLNVIVDNWPGTKRKAALKQEALEFEQREKNRKESERRYEENRRHEQERLWEEESRKKTVAKEKFEADQRALKLAQSKTKDEVKKELLNSLTGRRS
jgi:hypothetical protein